MYKLHILIWFWCYDKYNDNIITDTGVTTHEDIV